MDSLKNIKSWDKSDRPREKLIEKGVEALSDAELVAILIGSGSREESAVELSKRILHSVGNNLDSLGRLNINELMRFKGIGEAKAISIVSALELSRRRKVSDKKERFKIKSSKDVFELFSPKLSDLNYEEFWIALLSKSNSVKKLQRISSGGVDGTIVDIKIVLKTAIDHLCSAIILCHNHPSGNLKPSKADKDLTEKLTKAGKLVDINVLDHLIIAEDGYFSFADEGLM